MHISKKTILENEIIRLRIPSLDDIPHIFSASRVKGFNDGMLWEPPENMEELKPIYFRTIKAWEESEGFNFSIDDKKLNQFLGKISIRKTSEQDRWNTGFWTHPSHQGKGIMTQALALILEFGFNQLEANVIEACHALWNKAIEKVLIRNGMKFSKYLEKGFQKNGVWVEENLLEISKKEWLEW